MPRFLLPALCLLLLASCGPAEDAAPDVSDVQVPLQTFRFEQDFFALDTGSTAAGLDRLDQKYPRLLPIYLQYVLGVPGPEAAVPLVNQFLGQSRPLMDSVQAKYRDFSAVAGEIGQAFRYVRHYFPNHPLPRRLVTLIGPVDALAKLGDTYTPNFLGPDFLAISLQFYLGKGYSLYGQTQYIQQVAPLYRSRRFDREYIAGDALALIADDIYPDSSGGRPLIEQIVEKGKHWYLIDKFLPKTHDSLWTGYTGRQLEWCRENEGNIWATLLREDLYSADPLAVQTYIGEGPFTQTMPESSPGNIGPWVGLQIIRKWLEAKGDVPMQQLLQTPAARIFRESGYKPK